MHPFLYLASQSPRRQEILTQLGVRFELLLPDSSENAEALEELIEGESALAYVERVTLAKLAAAQVRLSKTSRPTAPILCADTTVAITIDGQERILGKPADASDAKRILNLLNGQHHQVHTAVAIYFNGKHRLLISSSEVQFANCDENLINAYIATGEPMGKAGAYGIQGLGGSLIESIHGSYSGIMGLPLHETARLLLGFDIQYSLHHD